MAVLAAFLRAVFTHWEVLLGGLIFNGLMFASAAFWSSNYGQTIPWQAYVAISAVFLFVACFMAWKDEYNRRQELEQVKPKFRLEIIRQMFGIVNNSLLGIQAIVGVRNVGTMQSVAGDWHMSLTDPNGKRLAVEQLYFAGNVTLEHNDGRKEVLGEQDLIDRKTGKMLAMRFPLISMMT